MATVTGGDKLKAALDKIAYGLASAKSVEVGFMEDATYPDGTKVALVAAINEYGAPSRGQPPRPFFRRMIKAKSGGWSKGLSTQLKESGYNAEAAFEKLGAVIKGQLQESINEFTSPPLALSTIQRKGHSHPLIDTGQMLNSVDYRVNK